MVWMASGRRSRRVGSADGETGRDRVAARIVPRGSSRRTGAFRCAALIPRQRTHLRGTLSASGTGWPPEGIPGFLRFGHSGLDPESSLFKHLGIQAFAGMTTEEGMPTHS